ncbi:MAG: tetratricopeptide repeat protein [Spirochaetales bacterium]|nr:tetratricopeptide repeat protein [Spirochaetales bacterium]
MDLEHTKRSGGSGLRMLWTASLMVCLLLPVVAREPVGTSGSVNTAAALRALQQAVDHINAGEWDQARFFAQLGTSYDSTLADFPYIDALALLASDGGRGAAIERLEQALATGRPWRSYDRKSAVLVCARLYAETTRYAQALTLLDEVASYSSADADYVSALCLYGTGRIREARSLISRAIDRWPFDPRFPRLFLIREKKGSPDDLSLNIASRITARLSVWENEDRELLLLTVPFEPSADIRKRNIRIYRGMGKNDQQEGQEGLSPLAALLALEYGLIDETRALEEVFSFSQTGLYRDDLVVLSSLIAGKETRARMVDILRDWNGLLHEDSNGDGLIDSRVLYQMGRPYHAYLDPNQDGDIDYELTCSLGKIEQVSIASQGISVRYETYPAVKTITQHGREYVMVPGTFSWAPVSWKGDTFNLGGEPLYTFHYTRSITALTEHALIMSATYYRESSDDGSELRVMLEKGVPLMGERRLGGRVYERILYTRGLPSRASRDENADGHFETIVDYDGQGEIRTISVDNNANSTWEYRETYSPDGSVQKQWDSDENGSWEVSWTLGADGTEESSWIHPIHALTVTVTVEAGSPRMVRCGESVLAVVRDPVEDLWWIGRMPNEVRDISTRLLEILNHSEPEVVSSILTLNGRRYMTVRTGGFIFVELINAR